MTPPQEISKLRPLPEEILAMSESETACQFCGISYLIQSKYDKMEKLVKDMQKECAKLRKYAEEHPALIARVEELEDERQRLLKSNTLMNTQLDHFKQREKEQRAELDLRNKEIHELKEEKTCQEQLKKKESEHTLYKEQKQTKLLNLQYDVIESRNELAHIIGLVRSNFSATLSIFCKSQLSSLAESINSVYEEKLAKYKVISENVMVGKEVALTKEIDNLKTKLSESNTRCDRLLQDIQVFKKEQADHLSGQKLYTQGLQTNCLELENRINAANREIMELSMERTKLDQERKKLVDLCNELKDREYHANSDLEKKVLVLQGENRELESKTEELQKKLEQQHIPDDSALKNAHLALAKKDEQMVALEKTIRELNTNLTNARIERNQTIEAHQSRIKQLQEKFLEDLKKDSDAKVDQVEFNLRKTLANENEMALKNLKDKLELEFAETRNNLMKQIELLKSHNINIQLKMEEKWNTREQDIQKHLKELSDRFQYEKNNYQVKVDGLTKKITELESKEGSNPSSLEDQLMQFQAKLCKKDTEIAFLKDTVRVECEERMGLVAMVAKLQKELQNKSIDMPANNVMEVESVRSEKETPRHKMSEKDSEFFKLIQNANMKNSKRLARQKIK
ncbi:Leucine-, glutamate- and lysine-rich protein 1 [Boothiomyces sp. JEL0866]|nr:Leucine-, glutamate- and lysine-rich protein 1 [Boothiomyces sp. JEL0866]